MNNKKAFARMTAYYYQEFEKLAEVSEYTGASSDTRHGDCLGGCISGTSRF